MAHDAIVSDVGQGGRWHFRVPEESPSCREQGAWGEPRAAVTGAADSPDRHAGFCRHESNRDDDRAWPGVKRAILPAAISDRAARRLLAEARG